MNHRTQLSHFSRARRELALAKDIDEVKAIRDKAEALRQYLKQAHESLDMQNECAEIKLRAERRGGQLLAAQEKHRGGRPHSENPSHDGRGFSRETLEALGINYNQSSRWQTIARMPEESFEEFIATTRANDTELTTADLLRTARMGVHYSSATSQWYTPPEIIARVKKTFGRPIDLDPCSNSKKKPAVPARRHLTERDDGLSVAWSGRVYMNPPYGRDITDWITKLCEEYEDGQVTEAVALVPSRTDTEWFRRLRNYPRCFIKGRLSFSGHEHPAPFPSMVVYLGKGVTRFARAFSDVGDIYRVHRRLS